VARLARLLTGIALAALIAVGLAACGGDGGGDGGGGENAAEGLTPAQLLTRSSAAAQELTSFHAVVAATGQIDLSGGGGDDVGGLLRGPLDISGEGPVQPPDKASLDVRLGLSGLPLQGNVTRVGDDVYVSFLGQDFALDLPPEQVALLDLGALYPTLVEWAKAPVAAGTEEIDGASTVKVEADLDPARALTSLAPVLGVSGVTPARAAAALRTGRFEAWIGTEDLLPRRVHVGLAADGARLQQDLGDVELDLTVDLSDFDAPVDITAPSDARPLDLNDLGSLVGG
jgi:hypothetical protein